MVGAVLTTAVGKAVLVEPEVGSGTEVDTGIGPGTFIAGHSMHLRHSCNNNKKTECLTSSTNF